MNNSILGCKIMEIFKKLNDSKLDYILIRNIKNELPNNLILGKDIDILVKHEQLGHLKSFLKDNSFKEIPHPHRHNIFLYGVKKFKFYRDPDYILFDLNFDLVCRSFDAGQWIPLDQVVQKSAWKNKRFHTDGEFMYWTLSYEDEFISLIVRSIFDKREFQVGYIERILNLYPLVNMNDVKYKMNLIFFSYTDNLIEQIKVKSFSNIIKNYIGFEEY
jgi:hypothetical protein